MGLKLLLNKFKHDQSGTTAIEFGLISMAFFTIVFGIFETGRLVLTQNALQYSIENATRYALINGDADDADILAYVAEDMNNLTLNTDNMDIAVSYSTASEINFIEVSGTYNFSPLILTFLPDSWANITLAASSRMIVQDCSEDNCPQ